MKTRFYYTLWEVINNNEAADNPNYLKSNLRGLSYLVEQLIGNNYFTDSTITTTFAQKYLWPQLYSEYIMYVDVEHNEYLEPIKPGTTNADYINAKKVFAGKFWSLVEETEFRYSELARMYEGQINNLMNQVKSTTVNRFNDTPQNEITSSQTYEDLTHNTTVTKNETAVDAGTVISRLDEIRQKLYSVYAEWVKAFEVFVIEE